MSIKLNDNTELVKQIQQQLKSNGGQCPCVPERLQSDDTKCPCKDFREVTEGECHCGLFIKTKD